MAEVDFRHDLISITRDAYWQGVRVGWITRLERPKRRVIGHIQYYSATAEQPNVVREFSWVHDVTEPVIQHECLSYIEQVNRNHDGHHSNFTAWNKSSHRNRIDARGLTFGDPVEGREWQVYVDRILCGKIFGTTGAYTGAVAFKDPEGYVVRDKTRTVGGNLNACKRGLELWIAECESGSVEGFNGWATPGWCYPDEN